MLREEEQAEVQLTDGIYKRLGCLQILHHICPVSCLGQAQNIWTLETRANYQEIHGTS